MKRTERKHHSEKGKPRGLPIQKFSQCYYCVPHNNDKSRKKVFLCKYCKEYFCKEHLKPSPAFFPRFNRGDPKSRLLMEEFHEENGHPCMPYYPHWEKQGEAESDAWGKTLDILAGKTKKHGKSIFVPPRIEEAKEPEEYEEINEPRIPIKPYSYPKMPIKNRILRSLRRHKGLVFLIVLSLFLIIAWKTRGFSKVYDVISDYSIDNNLGIFPSRYLSEENSLKSFNELNALREKNNYSTLEYNDEFYKKAVYASKMIYEGKEGGIKYDYVYDKMVHENNMPLSYEWDTLPDILNVKMTNSNVYDNYNEGAIGCYNYVCAFVGEYTKTQQQISQPTYSQETSNSKDYDLSESGIDVHQLEKQIHDLINQERVNNGLSALFWDDKLSEIARDHSEDMANRNFFSHYNPEEEGPDERGKKVGYSCYKDFGSYYMVGIAENIFQNNLYDSITYVYAVPIHDWSTQSEIAQSTVSGWMGSSGHRENILTATFDKEGIGIAISLDDKVYITQDFC